MGLRDGPEISKLQPRRSLARANHWPISRQPLEPGHPSFDAQVLFGGAMHAVLLLQKGYTDERACDLAGFMEEPPS
jgi:hypothetical protein